MQLMGFGTGRRLERREELVMGPGWLIRVFVRKWGRGSLSAPPPPSLSRFLALSLCRREGGGDPFCLRYLLSLILAFDTLSVAGHIEVLPLFPTFLSPG